MRLYFGPTPPATSLARPVFEGGPDPWQREREAEQRNKLGAVAAHAAAAAARPAGLGLIMRSAAGKPVAAGGQAAETKLRASGLGAAFDRLCARHRPRSSMRKK